MICVLLSDWWTGNQNVECEEIIAIGQSYGIKSWEDCIWMIYSWFRVTIYRPWAMAIYRSAHFFEIPRFECQVCTQSDWENKKHHKHTVASRVYWYSQKRCNFVRSVPLEDFTSDLRFLFQDIIIGGIQRFFLLMVFWINPQHLGVCFTSKPKNVVFKAETASNIWKQTVVHCLKLLTHAHDTT